MFNLAHDWEYEREFVYFRQTNHLFQAIRKFEHNRRNWFPANSKELDFDKERSSESWFALSI